MPSQLYIKWIDGDYQPTSFDNLDNKAFWCSKTEVKEEAFAKIVKEIREIRKIKKMEEFPWDIEVHPNKKKDPFHPDLICNCGNGDQIGEVKIKNSPLFFAKKWYEIEPQYALTMDLKDSFNYRRWLDRGIDIQIFIWVKWEAHRLKTWVNDPNKCNYYNVSPLKGIWTTKFSTLLDFERKNSPPIHWYKEQFRKPKIFNINSIEGQEALAFDRRLQISDYEVKGVTSNGFMNSNGVIYPAGHSSGSYVFDLSNKDLFEDLGSKLGY